MNYYLPLLFACLSALGGISGHQAGDLSTAVMGAVLLPCSVLPTFLYWQYKAKVCPARLSRALFFGSAALVLLLYTAGTVLRVANPANMAPLPVVATAALIFILSVIACASLALFGWRYRAWRKSQQAGTP